jgi:hypothetical protein
MATKSEKKGKSMEEFVNTPMPTELREKLEQMADAKGMTRVGLIRMLIRKEWARYQNSTEMRRILEADVTK